MHPIMIDTPFGRMRLSLPKMNNSTSVYLALKTGVIYQKDILNARKGRMSLAVCFP